MSRLNLGLVTTVLKEFNVEPGTIIGVVAELSRRTAPEPYEPLRFRRFRNHYACPDCENNWEEEADSTCNDRCPQCRAEIEPHHSEDI